MDAALALLRDLGAARIAHPGGTLLDHLVRVEQRLASYDTPMVLRRAGLMHAAYSTDGFDTALLPVTARDELREVIGDQAEQLVYRFGATARGLFYGQLGQPLVVWTDRFTGAAVTLDPDEVAPLVELTVANELDVVERAGDSAHLALRAVFGRARAVMSDAAWADVVAVLGN